MAILSKQNKVILSNRFKSLLWRLGAMAVAILIQFIIVNLELLSIPAELTLLIGLILGEVSKYLNIDLPKSRK